jgi:ring-1,2-phenylacetyl-CoA epoxidase subunit PaaD
MVSVWEIASRVTDPELPVVTLADLGILRDACETPDGTALVTITPTYSGCPAMAAIRSDLAARLRDEGYQRVEIRTVLSPPWTTDWITDEGRRKLAGHGIAPPGRAPRGRPGPVPLTLGPTRSENVPCPRCGSGRTEEVSAFGSTACKALRRCLSCGEPFENVKEI